MSETINPTTGLSFHLTDIHGYITGVTHGTDGAIDVFARAAEHDALEGTTWRMAHIKLGTKIADRNYGADYTVESWTWITRDDFDRIIDLTEIRKTLGWAA